MKVHPVFEPAFSLPVCAHDSRQSRRAFDKLSPNGVAVGVGLVGSLTVLATHFVRTEHQTQPQQQGDRG
jgi:hypothetical protein